MDLREDVLLLDREVGWRARLVSFASRLLAPFALDPLRAAVDSIVMLLLVVSIVLSVRIIADPASTSSCKTIEAPTFVQVAITMLPPIMIPGILYSSYGARYAVGAPQRPALALPQMVLGVVLAEWLAICACGLSTGAVLMVGTLVLAVVIGVCTSQCVGDGN